MENSGTIMDLIRAAQVRPNPSPEMTKRIEEFKKRKDAESRNSAVSGNDSNALDDLSNMFDD